LSKEFFMHSRKWLSAAALLAFVLSSAAQDTRSSTGWKYSVLTNLTLTLNSYSDNWAGSEFSAMSWGWQFTGTAEKPLMSWITNKNTLKLAFGQTAIQNELETGEKSWESPKKSSDLIDAESLLRGTFKSFADPFVSARAVSQFADMRVAEYTVYGNPLVLTESFGAIRDLRKGERTNWTARIGGAIRQSFDRNEQLQDSTIDDYTNDGGVEFITDFKSASKDNRLSFVSQLKVYAALFSSTSDKTVGTEQEDYWRYPDAAWENTLGVTLTKYMMLNLYAQLLYDREIDRDIRYRETVGLALTYSLAN